MSHHRIANQQRGGMMTAWTDPVVRVRCARHHVRSRCLSAPTGDRRDAGGAAESDCVTNLTFRDASYRPVFVSSVEADEALGVGSALPCADGDPASVEPPTWQVCSVKDVPVSEAVVVPDSAGDGGVLYGAPGGSKISQDPDLRRLLGSNVRSWTPLVPHLMAHATPGDYPRNSLIESRSRACQMEASGHRAPLHPATGIRRPTALTTQVRPNNMPVERFSASRVSY